jgi:hypothetical protein
MAEEQRGGGLGLANIGSCGVVLILAGVITETHK